MSREKILLRNPKCLRPNGCMAWQFHREGNPAMDFQDCERCGWNRVEAEMRKTIPLTLCPDGLRRKLIPPRHPAPAPDTEPEEVPEDD